MVLSEWKMKCNDNKIKSGRNLTVATRKVSSSLMKRNCYTSYLKRQNYALLATKPLNAIYKKCHHSSEFHYYAIFRANEDAICEGWNEDEEFNCASPRHEPPRHRDLRHCCRFSPWLNKLRHRICSPLRSPSPVEQDRAM